MKKSISNRDVERIAQHAGLPVSRVREVLALQGELPPETVERVMASAQALRYTISARDRVAMAAGTSVATVNRAYRPEARHLVRPDVLERIQAEARRLGYTPDLVAQARRTQGSPIVALCVELERLFNPYHARMLHCLIEAFTRRDRHPVITPILAGQPLPELAQSGVTSAVVFWEGPRTAHQVAVLAATGRRAVVIGRHVSLPSVAPDWVTAAEALTRRALTAGYDVLHLGYFSPDHWGPGARLEGAASALAAHAGRPPQFRLWVDPALDPAEAAAKLRGQGLHRAEALFGTLVQTPGALESHDAAQGAVIVDEMVRELDLRCGREGQRVAVLGLSDMAARQLLHALRHSRPQWDIGREVGLVGYDNIEPLLAYLDPVLTTVSYDMGALSERVVDLTLGEGCGRAPDFPFAVLPTQIVDRQSL